MHSDFLALAPSHNPGQLDCPPAPKVHEPRPRFHDSRLWNNGLNTGPVTVAVTVTTAVTVVQVQQRGFRLPPVLHLILAAALQTGL